MADKGMAGRGGDVDEYGLPPPRKGVLRGFVRDLRFSQEESAVGRIQIVDFNLHFRGDRLPVPVRMRGSDFTDHLVDGWLMDVPDPDPKLRPITPRRITAPWHEGLEVTSYYPGQDDPDSPGKGFGPGWL